MSNIVDYLELGAQVVGTASAVAALVPATSKLSGHLILLRKVLDLLALNVGNAKNKH